jgi:hypothetical protein
LRAPRGVRVQTVDDPLEVRLLIELGEPPSGVLLAPGLEIAFHGWIGLIAAINAARGHPPGGADLEREPNDHWSE